VVGAGGRLLIREPHAGLQRRLLETEGVTIEGRAVDMQRHGWTPGNKRKTARKRKNLKQC
jgi:alkylated DNA nucleotide flippase Atl1